MGEHRSIRYALAGLSAVAVTGVSLATGGARPAYAEEMGCPGETTTTMITGGVFTYTHGSQLRAPGLAGVGGLVPRAVF